MNHNITLKKMNC